MSALPNIEPIIDPEEFSDDDQPRDPEGNAGHDGSLQFLPVDALAIDREYQRFVNHKRIHQIASEFDADVLGVLVISRRDDGDFYVIDGQHRKEAVQLLYGKHKLVPCFVMSGLAHRDEARIFWKLNRFRLLASSADTFRARLSAGDETALAIKEIADSHNVDLLPYPVSPMPPNGIMAFSAAEDLYRAGMLDQVLGILRSAWPNVNAALSAKYMRGVHRFLVEWRPWFVDDDSAERLRRLIDIMAAHPPMDIERRAAFFRESLQSRPATAFARALHHFFNAGLRHNSRVRLPSWGIDDSPEEAGDAES